MSWTALLRSTSIACLAITVIVLGGCDRQTTGFQNPPAALMPQRIRIHPLTGTRVFDDSGGVSGIDVRIEAIDSFGDSTKAFGQFRLDLYSFSPRRPDPRGDRLAVWRMDLRDVQSNRGYWDNLSRTYQFRLVWDKPVAVGQKFVLVAVFEPAQGDRLFDQRVFVSGE